LNSSTSLAGTWLPLLELYINAWRNLQLLDRMMQIAEGAGANLPLALQLELVS